MATVGVKGLIAPQFCIQTRRSHLTVQLEACGLANFKHITLIVTIILDVVRSLLEGRHFYAEIDRIRQGMSMLL